MGKILIGMNKALGEIPVTVKLRTGVKDGRNTAHKLMPRLSTEFSAGCITVSMTLHKFKSQAHRFSYMVALVNNDIPGSRTGIISKNV